MFEPKTRSYEWNRVRARSFHLPQLNTQLDVVFWVHTWQLFPTILSELLTFEPAFSHILLPPPVDSGGFHVHNKTVFLEKNCKKKKKSWCGVAAVGGGRSGRKWAEVGAPNFLLRWHDTEVAIRTSTCKWLKHNCSRPVLPLQWAKKGIWWEIPLPPDCRPIAARPIAARLPPHPFVFFFDTIHRLQWVLASTCI